MSPPKTSFGATRFFTHCKVVRNMNPKNLKKKLMSKYKHRIELHAHTNPASSCSEVSPKELVRIYKELGYDAITITNHFIYGFAGRNKEDCVNTILEDYKEAEKYGEELGIKVYLGAEIRFTENINDYLIYGVDQQKLGEIYDLLPNGIEYFRKNYDMPRSVFLQAHPFRDGMERVSPDLLDGIEVFNLHPGHNSRVGLASVLALENNHKIITAGTDFHHTQRGHEGITALRCHQLPKDSFGLAKLLKSGDYLLETGRNNIIIP